MKRLFRYLFFIVILMSFFPNRFTINGTTIITILSILFYVPLELKNKEPLHKYTNSVILFMILWFIYSLITRCWIIDVDNWISYNRYLFLGLNYAILSTIYL